MNEPVLGYANYCSLKRAGADADRNGVRGHVSGARQTPYRRPWAYFSVYRRLQKYQSNSSIRGFNSSSEGVPKVQRRRITSPNLDYSKWGQDKGHQSININLESSSRRSSSELPNTFSLFDRVYIGTLLLPGKNYSNASYWVEYAAMQHKVASEFLQLYPVASHLNFAWHITEEGCLDDPVSLTRLVQLSAPLSTLSPNSPSSGRPGSAAGLHRSPASPLGQASTFQFTYDYTNAMNSSDGVSYYNMLHPPGSQGQHGNVY